MLAILPEYLTGLGRGHATISARRPIGNTSPFRRRHSTAAKSKPSSISVRKGACFPAGRHSPAGAAEAALARDGNARRRGGVAGLPSPSLFGPGSRQGVGAQSLADRRGCGAKKRRPHSGVGFLISRRIWLFLRFTADVLVTPELMRGFVANDTLLTRRSRAGGRSTARI
jgi:hypothetical protein